MGETRIASGILLVILGIWVLMQAVAGDLGRRLLSWGSPASTATATGSAPVDVNAGNVVGNALLLGPSLLGADPDDVLGVTPLGDSFWDFLGPTPLADDLIGRLFGDG